MTDFETAAYALRHTLSAATRYADSLIAAAQRGVDITPALSDALKHAERAAIIARELCHKYYPSPEDAGAYAPSIPGEISMTDYGAAITLPRLLPARGRDAGYIRSAVAEIFRGRERVYLTDIVLAVEQQYNEGLPPRKWRDHDNVELTALINELCLWALCGDDPVTVDLFQFAAKGMQNATVIHLIPRCKFTVWAQNVWGKCRNHAAPAFTPQNRLTIPASTGGFAPRHEPTGGSSATWN